MGRAKHLQDWERVEIETGLNRTLSITDIAKQLNRSKSCISKEIRLNTDPATGKYKFRKAGGQSRERQYRAKAGTVFMFGKRVKPMGS